MKSIIKNGCYFQQNRKFLQGPTVLITLHFYIYSSEYLGFQLFKRLINEPIFKCKSSLIMRLKITLFFFFCPEDEVFLQIMLLFLDIRRHTKAQQTHLQHKEIVVLAIQQYSLLHISFIPLAGGIYAVRKRTPFLVAQCANRLSFV